jgi:hypothetical protein
VGIFNPSQIDIIAITMNNLRGIAQDLGLLRGNSPTTLKETILIMKDLVHFTEKKDLWISH